MQCHDMLIVQCVSISEGLAESDEISEEFFKKSHGGEGGGCGEIANCLCCTRSISTLIAQFIGCVFYR